MPKPDYRNEYGVNLGHFSRKVHEWAVNESWARGRDVTFWEVFAHWCDYVHPNGQTIAAATRGILNENAILHPTDTPA